MNFLIVFLKLTWFWFLCVVLGVWIFLNLPLDEFTLAGKVVAFIICIIVLPLFGQGIYSVASEKLGDSIRPIRFGCVTFLLGLVLYNNLPLQGMLWWVKFLLGAILFAVLPLLVQMVFGDEKKE